MSKPSSPNESDAERLFSAERDRVEFSPAQPTGPERIDDDEHAEPEPDTLPLHVKSERGGQMKH